MRSRANLQIRSRANTVEAGVNHRLGPESKHTPLFLNEIVDPDTSLTFYKVTTDTM
jgi:hypothetical protein